MKRLSKRLPNITENRPIPLLKVFGVQAFSGGVTALFGLGILGGDALPVDLKIELSILPVAVSLLPEKTGNL